MAARLSGRQARPQDCSEDAQRDLTESSELSAERSPHRHPAQSSAGCLEIAYSLRNRRGLAFAHRCLRRTAPALLRRPPGGGTCQS